MLVIKVVESVGCLSSLKARYFEQSTAPLDGMWHFGFVPMSNHFGFYENESLVGYCCINSDGYMLQFYLSESAETQPKELFTLIADQNSSVIGTVKGAFVSTAEPQFLSLCLDNSTTFKVNALMYQQVTPTSDKVTPTLSLEPATEGQLSSFVAFAAVNMGAPEQWLAGYFGNLINRKELWGYWKDGNLLVSGECRLFDEHQTGYADLGMIVAESERGKGLATRMLISLVKMANTGGLVPICSTESSNIGAQKAIYNAGLSPLNRLVQIDFNQ